MRLKFLFMTMIAALAFAGCSSEDDPINKGDENTDDSYGYVAVNIVEPKSIDTRAVAGYEDGTNTENNAATALFCVYKTDGTMQCDPRTINLTEESGASDNNPYVEKVYKAVLVIDGVKEADKLATNLELVCVLNAPSTLTVTKTTSLATLKQQINDYGSHTDGTFIMTNSVYKNGDMEVCGATVTGDDLKTSASDALEHPVEIYVERVVARIQAKAGTSFGNQGATPSVDGTEKSLTINVTGIEVANIAQKSYLFKNISGFSYGWAWDVTNKRSYWETVPLMTGDNALTFGNKSYKDIATETSFNITTLTNFKEYVQPNTSAQKTAILVTAQLMDGSNPADLAYIRGGYTTKAGAKNVILTYLQSKGYCKKVSDSPAQYTSIVADDIEWVNNEDLKAETGSGEISWLESYEVVARVKSSVTDLFINNAGTYTSTTTTVINTDLAGTETSHPYVARVYTDGKCYYYVNIDQSPVAGTGTTAHTYDGVIRNHIYDLTLNSIRGVGTPVFDPEDVIIPDQPTDETLWFIGARVNVLKWRIVKQNVDFSGN